MCSNIYVMLNELECAARMQTDFSSAEDRKRGEDKILQLRQLDNPYELCNAILTQSSNDFLLYEAGRCLSHAVVREWDSVFAADREEPSKSYQLLTFILQWAVDRGFQVSSAARQRVLGAAGALVKRAAAAHAAKAAAEWHAIHAELPAATSRFRKDRVLTSPPDDPGPPCPLFLHFIEHIEGLVRPFMEQLGHSDVQTFKHCLLGVSMLSALLDEMSNSDDSTQLDMSLETHIFLQTRFQDFELLRLFQMLLCLTDRLLQAFTFPIGSCTHEQNELIFRIVTCLETVISWDFLPRELRFKAVRLRRTGQGTCFLPSLRWSIVFGTESLPATLCLLIKLHTWIRSSDTLGSRTLSCLVRLSAMSGPLTDPVASPIDSEGRNRIMGDVAPLDAMSDKYSNVYLYHILIFLEHMNYWLGVSMIDNPSSQPSSSILTGIISIDQENALHNERIKRLVNPNFIPHLPLDQLNMYELPLLSELVQNIVLRFLHSWEPVIMSVSSTSTTTVNRRSSRHMETMIHDALLFLLVTDRFLSCFAALLIQFIKVLATRWLDTDGDEPLAHAAVERLFNSWVDLLDTVLPTDDCNRSGTDALTFSLTDNNDVPHEPLALVTKSGQHLNSATDEIRPLRLRLLSSISQHQINLFQTYILSKLSGDVGLRPSLCASKPNNEVDLELDEPDLFDSESSLYAVGICGTSAPEESLRLLLQLMDERVHKLLGSVSDDLFPDQLIDVYEDLHWLLLVTGHFLVHGTIKFPDDNHHGSSWMSDLKIPGQLLRLGTIQTTDVAASRQLLHLVASRCIAPTENWPPNNIPFYHISPVICLLASIFRLLWLQVSYGLGSAQLVADNFWLVTRIAIAYFCEHDSEREILLSTEFHKSQSLLFIILRKQPEGLQPAHSGNEFGVSTSVKSTNGTEEKQTPEGCELVHTCIQGLLMCSRLGLNRWSSEPQVLTAITRLLQVLSRHSPNPSHNLSCSAWFEICTALCGTDACKQTWPNVDADNLRELITTCLCGSWAIDKSRLSPALSLSSANERESDTLLLQLFRSLRERIIGMLTEVSLPTWSATVSSIGTDMVFQSFAVLRGVTRSVPWLVAGLDSPMDLLSIIWTGLLAPILDFSANQILTNCRNCFEITYAILSLYAEVANFCLLYLICLSSGQTNTVDAQSEQNALYPANNATASPTKSASVMFLNLVLQLVRNYAAQKSDKGCHDAGYEDNLIAELQVLMKLLMQILLYEYDLRIGGLIVVKPSDANAANSVDPNSTAASTSVQVVVLCLDHLLPLITQSILMIPDLCRSFFSLASYVCELRIECLDSLSDEQLSYFGRLMRLGIFGQSPNSSTETNKSDPAYIMDESVAHSCLEVLVNLTDHCLEIRSQQLSSCSSESAVVKRLCTHLGLDAELLQNLFMLLTTDSYPANLESVFASAILGLINVNPESYTELVHRWLNGCQDQTIRHRLQTAFERLSCSANSDSSSAGEEPSSLFVFNAKKPSRTNRLEFQQRFHTFAVELRAFAYRG